MPNSSPELASISAKLSCRGRAERGPRRRVVVGAAGARTRWRARAGSRPRELVGVRAPVGPEDLGVGLGQRRLVRRAQQVLGEDLGAVRVEDRGLDGPAEELVGVPAEELVERVLAGDVHREPAAAAAGAAPHLPEARDRAREGHADRGVELADVDPELERVGRDDSEQLAGAQPALDLLALLRACSRRGKGRSARRARARAGRREWRRISSMPLRDFMKQIVRAPSDDELREHLGRLVQRRARGCRAPRRAAAGSTSRRGGCAAAPRRRSTSLKSVRPVRRLGELDRVGDRRARQQEARLGAVDRGDASQAPEHVGDVRAEHAAVDVRLVDDDEREVREQVAPRGVVGQDPDVEHVGVGEDQVASACGSPNAPHAGVSPS